MSIEERIENIERLTLLQAKEALNMDDAAAYTGLSKDHIYKLVSQKRIPYYKNEGGKLTFFSKSELCSWLLKHRVGTIEEAEEQAAAYAASKPRKGGKR